MDMIKASLSRTEQWGIQVPATSLGDYFSKVDKLDFIKMDIEGAESYAIPGMCDVLRRLRPKILLGVPLGSESAVEELCGVGYRLLDLDFQPVRLSQNQDDKLNHVITLPQDAVGG